MRRLGLACVMGLASVACGAAPAPSASASALVLEIRIDQTAPGATTAEGTVSVGMQAERVDVAPGCHLLPTDLTALPEGASVSVRVGAPVQLASTDGVAGGAFGVLDRQLAWTAVGLEAEAAGGWMIRERGAAQVPEAPALVAVVRDQDGGVTAHRQEGGPAVSLEVDTAAGTWRCDGPGAQVSAPWWLARGEAGRVLAVVERVERHRTADGLDVVGRVRVRVPVEAAARSGQQARRLLPGSARG